MFVIWEGLYAHPVEQVNLFNSLGNIISYEKEFHIDQKNA